MRPYWRTALFTVVLFLYLLLPNRFFGPVFADVDVDVGLDTETNLDSKISLVKLDFSLSMDGFQLECQPVLDSEKKDWDFETATINKKIGPAFVEAGIKDWIWGQEFILTPTYPLERDKSYEGLEGSLAWPGHNLAVGAARDRKDSAIYAGWARMGFLLDNKDFTLVMSCKNDSLNRYTNVGGEFSYDLLNGITLYSGLNVVCGEKNQYALGMQYLSKNDFLYTLEQTYHTDNFIGLDINNYASIYRDWQGEIRIIHDLTDSGTLQVLKVKYNKSNKVIPSLEFYHYRGPDISPMIYFLSNYNYDWDSSNRSIPPSEKGMVFKITVKL